MSTVSAFLEWIASHAVPGMAWAAAVIVFFQTRLGGEIFDVTFKHYFDKKISDIKHDHDKKLSDIKYQYERGIENLRADLSFITDRGKHSNEKEYQSLISCWEAFIVAYHATRACVARFTTFPDLSRMEEGELDEFLDSNPVFLLNKKFIKSSSNMNLALGRVDQLDAQNQAKRNISAAHDVLHKQSVFMSPELEGRFEAALDSLHKTWAEQYVQFNSRGSLPMTQSMELLGPTGSDMKSALRDAVRQRALRDSPIL